MNEKNLIKRIRQVEEHIKILEESEMDDVLRKERIERNKLLRRFYEKKLRDLKWNWLLKGNDIKTLLN